MTFSHFLHVDANVRVLDSGARGSLTGHAVEGMLGLARGALGGAG